MRLPEKYWTSQILLYPGQNNLFVNEYIRSNPSHPDNLKWVKGVELKTETTTLGQTTLHNLKYKLEWAKIIHLNSDEIFLAGGSAPSYQLVNNQIYERYQY